MALKDLIRIYINKLYIYFVCSLYFSNRNMKKQWLSAQLSISDFRRVYTIRIGIGAMRHVSGNHKL